MNYLPKSTSMTLLTNNSSVKVILVHKKASGIEKTLLSKKKVSKSALKKILLAAFEMILLTIERKGIRNEKFKSMQIFFDIQIAHLSVFEVTDVSRSNLKKIKPRPR